MKIAGLTIKPYQEHTFDILGSQVTFRAGVVTDYKTFTTMCPMPKPPLRIMRGGDKIENVNDPGFKKKMEKYNTARVVYMIMKSLEMTEGLEFTICNLEEPESLTMENLLEEFTSAGIPEMFGHKIINLATSANGLTESILEAARKDFSEETLQEAESPEKFASQSIEASSMQSGELAKD